MTTNTLTPIMYANLVKALDTKIITLFQKAQNGNVMAVPNFGLSAQEILESVGAVGRTYLPESHLKDLLKKIKYKNWNLSAVYYPSSDKLCLRVVSSPFLDRDKHILWEDDKEVDIYSRNLTTPIYSEMTLSHNMFEMPDEYIVRQIFEYCVDLERHESKESFYFAGVRVFDPHFPQTFPK